jgi:Protein of unknown function (DUF1549)/Protein of unknown function (DUF1588)
MRQKRLNAMATALATSAAVLLGCSSDPTGGSGGPSGSDTLGGWGGGSAGTAPPQAGPGGTPPTSGGNGGAATSGNGGSTAGNGGSTTGSGTGSGPSSGGTGTASGSGSALDNRVVDYGEALRTASLKLVGDLPTLAQIQGIENATSATVPTAYAADIDQMLADPRFATQMIQWWRDTLKTGQPYSPTPKGAPGFDTAATFAAMVVVNDQPFTDILTATTGTCPTFANGTFTAADCTNNAPTAGVLTDPGIQAQYFQDMAFRRVRFIQETFACSPFPAEYATAPTPMGQGLYTSPWAFSSIAGGATAKVNFQDTSAVICANCHTTLNHMAPLFAYFDANGQYKAGQIQVQTPVVPAVTSTLTDWLPAGQGFAWRDGTPVTDIPSLAQTIAKDPTVAQCAVNRVWDWAFNRGDIVNDLATIPTEVTAPLVTSFTGNGMKLKSVIRAVLTSDDFVRF